MKLPKLCLAKSKSKTCTYQLQHTDNILYVTTKNDVKSIVRQSVIKPEIYGLNFVDDIFLKMINAASSVLHDVYVLTKDKPALTAIATEMGRWDSIPKNIVVSKTNKMPLFQNDTIEVAMKGCTCSNILNNIGAKFPVNVIRTNIPLTKWQSRNCEVAYFLASPECCGCYNIRKTGIQMIVRPVACYQMIFV
ncbi:MAG: hypothetical protein Q7R33_03600 [Nitrosarchaeum sp.]|nr:hypothetical protein [Nitrosarchaeum sp.]